MADYPTIPTRRNIALAVLLILLQLFQLYGLPLLLPRSALWGLLLIPLIATGNSMWSLIHEIIHRLFCPDAKANDRWGRGLAVMFGVSFDIVKFGHLMHHRYNRDWESEWYDPERKSRWQAVVGYYSKLCGGLYFIEIAASLLFLLPEAIVRKLLHRHAQTQLAHLNGIDAIAQNYFFRRRRVAQVREEMLAIMLVYGLSAWAYGAYWPWFALMLAGRAFTVSFMDNVYHYATPVDNSVPAKELSMPAWLAALMLQANHHHSHHRQADVSWNGLKALKETFSIDYQQTFWQAARQQFHGPLLLKK